MNRKMYEATVQYFTELMQLLHPFMPFITEEIYHNLKTKNMPESIHLCDYVKIDKKLINVDLEQGMQKIRSLVEVGRALRSKVGIKVRCPLGSASLICNKKVETSLQFFEFHLLLR